MEFRITKNVQVSFFAQGSQVRAYQYHTTLGLYLVLAQGDRGFP
jgi:hypothetical protein